MATRPGFITNMQPVSGRMREFRWLESQVDSRRRNTAIAVCGLAGIGKTALVSQLLLQNQTRSRPLWIDLESASNWEETTQIELASMRDSEADVGELVVADGAERLSDKEFDRLYGVVFNYKRVRTLIVTSRTRPVSSRFEILELNSLEEEISASLLRERLPDLTQEESVHVAKLARGNPLVLQLIGQLGSSYNKSKLLKLLDGYIYDLSSESSAIIVAAKPKLIAVTDDLVSKLKRNPEDVYRLTPRKFEELIAEILKDRGWEVELTKETRDGGKDIIAYRETDVGKLLCLVEAKRYRRDRPVGVSLIRNLYGTLCDANATSGMIVTTSTFTQDAKTFQERHQYKLALRDYTHLVDWINCYGNQEQ
jgi:restriction endonuclease Mrr